MLQLLLSGNDDFFSRENSFQGEADAAGNTKLQLEDLESQFSNRNREIQRNTKTEVEALTSRRPGQCFFGGKKKKNQLN